MSAVPAMTAAVATALVAISLAHPSHAQSALPPVQVDPPAPRKKTLRAEQSPRQALAPRAQRRAAARQAARPRVSQPVSSSGPRMSVAPSQPPETGISPVKGYVAQVSRAGTKTDTPLIKTPQSISVVTSDQMQDQAARSVADAFRYTPGVLTDYRGSSNLHDEMFVRGFSYVPRFLNGLVYGSNSFGQIDPYLLERVELIRGPASVLYGQANPGGIVNMVSKLPTFTRQGEAFLGFGSDGRITGGLDMAGLVNPDLAYRIVGMGLKADGQEDHVEQKRFAIAPSFTWRPNEQTKLTVYGFYQYEPDAGYRNFLERSGTIDRTIYGYVPRRFFMGEPGYDRYRREQAAVGYQFEHRFNDMLLFRQSARYNVIDTDFRTLVEWSMGSGLDANLFTRKAGAGPEKLNQFVIDNHVQADFETGWIRHKVLAGLDYQWALRRYAWGYAAGTSTIDWTNPIYGLPVDTNFVYNTNTSTRADQLGVYAQDQIEIGRLNILVGLRQDWASSSVTDFLAANAKTHSDSGALTWRAGAIYNFENGLAPYVSYSTSFEPVLEVPQAGQAPFKPTEAQQFEAGLKYAPPGTRILLTGAYYDLTQQNILTRASWADPYKQIGEVRNRGFEFEARAELTDNLSLIASYSHIKSKVTESEDTGILGRMPPRIPRDQAALWAKYDFRDPILNGLSLGGGIRYVGQSWGNDINTFKVPEATLFDAMVSYDLGARFPNLKGVKLQVNATNIGDTRYVASCNSAYACFYGMGRVVTGQIRYTW